MKGMMKVLNQKQKGKNKAKLVEKLKEPENSGTALSTMLPEDAESLKGTGGRDSRKLKFAERPGVESMGKEATGDEAGGGRETSSLVGRATWGKGQAGGDYLGRRGMKEGPGADSRILKCWARKG